jgi:hypothetical protein
MMGMQDFSVHLDRYHNPRTGRQGVWGRWNMVQEQALHPDGSEPDPDIVHVTRGHASTSNGCEGRVNKRIKEGTGQALPLLALVTKAQRIMTNLDQDMTGIRYSLVADQQGECKKTKHPKQAGAKGAQTTGKHSRSYYPSAQITIPMRLTTSPASSCVFVRRGRDYRVRFLQGINDHRGKLHGTYNWKMKGVGASAEYLCATDVTKSSVQQWLKFHRHEPSFALIKGRVKTLRDTWLQFAKDPHAHVQDVLEVRNPTKQGTCFPLTLLRRM